MASQITLKYQSDQPFQLEAVSAVTDLFRGQEFLSRDFTAQMGREGTLEEGQVISVGHANELRPSPRQLLENLHAVQERNALPETDVLTNGRLRDFTVEMETGTGKTYVYIRTIFELHKRFGLTKFCIVVPSVAIREGVLKSFRSMHDHFATLYDNDPMDVFVYDSKEMGPVGNFATSSSVQVMIINIGAFNKGYTEDGNPDTANIFHRPSEKLMGGRSPQELVSACKPIVIIDEPQSVDNTPKAKGAIKSLNPLFVLRYSATHKEKYNPIYRLSPVDAYQQHLVKGICVDSVRTQEDLNGHYVRLDSTTDKPSFSAKVTIDVRQKDGSQKRKSVKVKTGDSLFDKSKENSDYEAGWIVSNIGTAKGSEFIEFTNGKRLVPGAAEGDVAAEAVKRAQIRRTIEDHLERQLEMWPRHIKVLSLFFIDKVEKYRVYTKDGWENGEYAEVFEQEYADLLEHGWKRRYEEAGVPLIDDPAAVHSGYFSKDGKGRFKDTRGTTDADTSTFELIMREKETLIAFPDGKNHDKDVSFIWSHSALKEGWDNPNIFQICTLVETKDTLTKRQKVGRGLRLPVDQSGERCLDPEANVLTVVANESYDAFARGLQSELDKDGVRFGVIAPESFSKVIVRAANGTESPIGFEKSKQVFESLQKAGLVSKKGEITLELKKAAQDGKVELPAGLEEAKEQVEAIILHKAQKLEIKDKSKEVRVRLDKDVSLSPAFQALWERIRRCTKFQVEVDSDELVARCIEEIQKMPPVRPLEVLSMRADLSVDDAGVTAQGTEQSTVNTKTVRAYDLPDPIAELQDAVDLTRHTLKRILVGCGRYNEFPNDPATFLAQVASRIETAKSAIVSRGIKYVRLPEDEWYTMKDLEPGDIRAYLGQNAWEPEHGKSLYNYVVYDSSTVEKAFAVELDQTKEIEVFAKLPSKFTIDTPLGPYNPDWAYVVNEDGEHRVYFVTETKGGGNNDPHLRPTEQLKVDCAKKHFAALGVDDLTYDVRTTLHSVAVK